jgi:O-6-methylguanine DNA methyltransferase
MQQQLYVHTFDSAWGRVCLASTASGLALLTLPGQKRLIFEKLVGRHFAGFQLIDGGPDNLQAENEIAEYLAGKRKTFEVRLDLVGTPFQCRVLKVVARIPYGHTATYGAIAKKIGKPGASRAVGAANGHNCLPIIIPCHRVVAATGLGGYGGGLEMKTRLLQLEGVLM